MKEPSDNQSFHKGKSCGRISFKAANTENPSMYGCVGDMANRAGEKELYPGICG